MMVFYELWEQLSKMHECPECAFIMEDSSVEICPNCGFDFNATISCPYKISNRCIHNQNVCAIYGLNYEDCKIYLHKSGISS